MGIREVLIARRPGDDPLQHFCHPLPPSVKLTLVDADATDAFESLRAELTTDEFLLALEGHALNDRRVLKNLLQCNVSCAILSPTGSQPGAAAILAACDSPLFDSPCCETLTGLLDAAIRDARINTLDLASFQRHVINLRRKIEPFLLRVEHSAQLKEADRVLRQTVHKGVLEFVGKYIHPPLEFGATRLLAKTSVTPNQITALWLSLAAITIGLFATGHLLAGIILAALCGVLDGIDGKLARLTLQFSKAGDVLDHVGGTVFDACWYLALGWYFTGGQLNSTAGIFTAILLISYIVERIIPGIFKKIHRAEIYDYAEIDKLGRLVGSRMNNNVWFLMSGIILGFAREAFYGISLWMLATACWHLVRFFWVTWRTKARKPALNRV